MRKAIQVSLEESVIEKLNAKVGDRGNRSRYVESLICLDLEDPVKAGKSDAARTQADADAKLSSLLDQALADRLARDPKSVIEALDPKTLANLVARRSPKPEDQDADLVRSYLSLTESLGQAASLDDISAELSKLRNQVKGLKAQLEFERKNVIFMRSRVNEVPGAWEQYRVAMREFADRCRAYAMDAEARGIEVDDLRPLIVYPGKELSDAPETD